MYSKKSLCYDKQIPISRSCKYSFASTMSIPDVKVHMIKLKETPASTHYFFSNEAYKREEAHANTLIKWYWTKKYSYIILYTKID